MSDFWIYLVMTAMLFAALALIKFFSWLTLIQERGGIKQIARETIDRYVVTKPVPQDHLLSSEWLSYASEQVGNKPEQAPRFPFPDAVPGDNDIMIWLAFMPGEGDNAPYRFSASAIGKLFGGRLQDQIDRVRLLRGEEKPPERTIKVRDMHGEREIAIDG